MKFQRSNAGLSNLYLFYQVDAIVFVEGGSRNLNFEAIESGDFNVASHDAKFWSKLFDKFIPRNKFKFRAIGSKTTLHKLAALIALEQITNVVVCMDRDFDHFLGKLIPHSRVMYTHGYSWENEAWCPLSAIRIYRKLSNTAECDEAVNEIKSSFHVFERALRWPLVAHALLVTNGILQVTTAELEQTVMRGAGQMPTLNPTKLRAQIINARPKNPKIAVRFATNKRFSTLDDCYGHLLATYAFHMIAYALRKHCNIRSFGREVAASVAIDSSYYAIMKNENKRKHYEERFAALRACLSAKSS